jgi:hypothetical protein
MMTEEQFEQNFHLSPTLGCGDDKEQVKMSFKLWDNRTGKEVFNLELHDCPEKYKDSDFYSTVEWENRIRPELVNVFYQLHSLLLGKRL